VTEALECLVVGVLRHEVARIFIALRPMLFAFNLGVGLELQELLRGTGAMGLADRFMLALMILLRLDNARSA
jgi:hypothetical protein